MTEAQQATFALARQVVAQKSKAFEAALASDPSVGRVRPFGFQPWLAAVMADIDREPKLWEAAQQAPDTLHDCLMVAANCGLLPGAAHGQYFLIPRWNSKRWCMTCTAITGYKGLADMAYRHQRVHRVEAFVAFVGDEFEWEPGKAPKHRWNPDVDRTDVGKDFENILVAYSRVVLTVPGGTHVDQEPLVFPMTRKELLATRARSEAWKAMKGASPWATDPLAMIRKTPLRRHLTGGSIPKSTDLFQAMAFEDHEAEKIEREGRVEHDAVKGPSDRLRGALGLPASAPATEQSAG